MTNQDETPHAENSAADAQNAMEQATEAVGERMRATVEQVTEAAQHAADAATSASLKASEGTAQAFDAARDRLRGLSDGSFGTGALMDQMKAQSEVFAGPLGDSYQRAAKGLAEFNAKALEAWRANAEATIAHWRKLAGVKSFSEVIALNSEHARKQMDALTTQTRELADLAGKISQIASQPIQSAAKKTGGF